MATRTTVNISLTPELQGFLLKLVETGRYQTTSEVVRDALRLLERQERDHKEAFLHLKAKLTRGSAQAERGELLDGNQVFDELGAELKTASAPRLALLQQIVAHCQATNVQYASLFRAEVNSRPIAYFGNPLTARVATFGVNPSATEFTGNRWLQPAVELAQLDYRSVNYFCNPDVEAHPWFKGYETSLNILEHSYQNPGRADTVHLDLSPRATRAMRSVDPKLFVKMVVADLKWFLSTLGLCKNLEAAIMSGSVTGKYYFNEFFIKHLPAPYSLKLNRLLGKKRRGATALYHLVGPEFSIPVFFCSTSPSGDGGVQLANEVRRNLPELLAAGF